MVFSRILIALLALLNDGSKDDSRVEYSGHSDSTEEEFPIMMQTSDTAVVRQGMMRWGAIQAKIYRGAVIRVKERNGASGCSQGWVERFGGGFICRKYLKNVDDHKPSPASLDVSDLIDGFDAYKVAKTGPKMYRSLRAIDAKDPHVRLRRGSVLVVRNELKVKGVSYFKTRQGWYVESDKLEKLPPRVETLAVGVGSGEVAPLGIAIRETGVFSSPSETGEIATTFKKWEVIPKTPGFEPKVEKGWIRIQDNRYVQDIDVARRRKAPLPSDLGNDERIIAVDLAEQLLHAYEGERLVKIVPVSTGKSGNTKPGKYRIQWKRRSQTMRLRMGSVRVEDVQWVMYYNRKASIAIHSAYWHSDFGTPVSHGCVNLPMQDARWLFEWSTPWVVTEDSERFPVPGNPGSRVIVFE